MVTTFARLQFTPGLPDPVIPPDHWAILHSPYFWTAISLGFIGVFCIRYWMLHRNPPPPPSVFNRSAALQSLHDVAQEDIPARETAAQIWNITRRYLSNAHKISALHHTTYEIFQKLRQSPEFATGLLTPRLLAKFEPLGEACELCEFGTNPLPERRNMLISLAIELITNDNRHVE